MTLLSKETPAGWPWRSLVMAALAALVFAVGGAGADVFVYAPRAVEIGELWRFITGHLVHSDGEHLLWNIGGLLVLGALFERRLGRCYFPLFTFGAAVIGGWLWWWSGLAAYCGLSGLLNTFLAGGLVAERKATGSWLPALVGVGAFSKILVEIYNREALFTSTLWPAVPEVHLVGFLAGLIFSWVVIILIRWKQRAMSVFQENILNKMG